VSDLPDISLVSNTLTSSVSSSSPTSFSTMIDRLDSCLVRLSLSSYRTIITRLVFFHTRPNTVTLSVRSYVYAPESLASVAAVRSSCRSRHMLNPSSFVDSFPRVSSIFVHLPFFFFLFSRGLHQLGAPTYSLVDLSKGV
jgi:hypothetical protein